MQHFTQNVAFFYYYEPISKSYSKRLKNAKKAHGPTSSLFHTLFLLLFTLWQTQSRLTSALPESDGTPEGPSPSSRHSQTPAQSSSPHPSSNTDKNSSLYSRTAHTPQR